MTRLTPKERVKIPRQRMPEQEPLARRQNFQEVNLGLAVPVAATEASRCIECASPKCVQGCPVGVKIREFVDLVLKEDYKAAAALMRQDNLLPAITGRVCPQEDQCEGACVMGKKFDPLRLSKRVWTADESLTADLEIAHFGPSALPQATVYWKLVDLRGQTKGSGSFGPQSIPLGNANPVGRITAPLAHCAAPEQLKLVVGLDQPRFENDWDLWVYPPSVDLTPAPDVQIADDLTEAVLAHVTAGGKALVLVPPARVAGDVQLGFSPIFWNTAWTQGQAPHTLGILCNPSHAALALFPTEFHSNWQWWDLLHQSSAFVLFGLTPDVIPAEYQAEGLLSALTGRDLRGKRYSYRARRLRGRFCRISSVQWALW